MCIFFVFLFIWSIYLHIWQHKRALWISWRVWDCSGALCSVYSKDVPSRTIPKNDTGYKQMFVCFSSETLGTQLIGVSFFFFEIHVHKISILFRSVSCLIFFPPFLGKSHFFPINALFRQEEEEASDGEGSNEVVLGQHDFFTPQKTQVIGGHIGPKKKTLR